MNAEEGQTHVFIGITLHNNTTTCFLFFLFFLFLQVVQKEKTDVIKGHNLTDIFIWKNVYLLAEIYFHRGHYTFTKLLLKYLAHCGDLYICSMVFTLCNVIGTNLDIFYCYFHYTI